MYVTSFPRKFYGHMFISLKVISALLKKEKEGYDTAFGGLCIFAYQWCILSAIFHFVFFQKNIHILLFQKQILMADFIIIRLQTISKATLI